MHAPLHCLSVERSGVRDCEKRNDMMTMQHRWSSGAPSMFSLMLLSRGPVLKYAQIEKCKQFVRVGVSESVSLVAGKDGGGELEVWEVVDDESVSSLHSEACNLYVCASPVGPKVEKQKFSTFICNCMCAPCQRGWRTRLVWASAFMQTYCSEYGY